MRRRLPVRFIAFDELREFAMGMAANERRKRSELARLFPWVDFSFFQSEEDMVGPATIDEEKNLAEVARASTSTPVKKIYDLSPNGHRHESRVTFASRIRDFKRIVLERYVLETPDTQFAALGQPFSVNLRDYDNDGATTHDNANLSAIGCKNQQTPSEQKCAATTSSDSTMPLSSKDSVSLTLGFSSSRMQALHDLMNSPGERVALVSHSSFLGQMAFNVFTDSKRSLRHVYPYHYVIDSIEQTPTVNADKWERKLF